MYSKQKQDSSCLTECSETISDTVQMRCIFDFYREKRQWFTSLCSIAFFSVIC